MSPSEADLRAALRDGEGDGFSADRVVIAAQRRRAQRRTRLLTTAASVVVVAAIGGGITAIARSGSNDQSGASNGGAKGPLAERSAAVAGTPVPAYGRSVTYLGCPATFPHYELPGGGSPGQFGSNSALFSKPVTAAVVCFDSSKLQPVTLARAQQAARLAESLESASPRPNPALCPLKPALPTLAIVGYAVDGSVVGTVTATPSRGCSGGAVVTNGTAVRYDWTPPADVASAITSALASQASVPPGIMHGSPVAS